MVRANGRASEQDGGQCDHRYSLEVGAAGSDTEGERASECTSGAFDP